MSLGNLGQVSTRPSTYSARVLSCEEISPQLARLRLGGDEMAEFEGTGIADEWVSVTPPGQFQSRYYTVRAHTDGVLSLDVVLHDAGLVTDWVVGGCVDDEVVVTAPSGSFAPTADAGWLLLAADLTGLPAVARIIESRPDLPTRVWIEAPEPVVDYLPPSIEVSWHRPPQSAVSDLARVVEGIQWPNDAGYFWMAGESAQMRAVRRHLMRDRALPKSAYHVMGYWRAAHSSAGQSSVHAERIWREGQVAGRDQADIWASYDDAVSGAR
jgi:NADPH-dependent ferric siderophore reductase